MQIMRGCRDCIYLAEWFYDASNTCDECKRVGCGACISTCMRCANSAKDITIRMLCADCALDAKLTKLKCRYHPHTVCEKCSQKKCFECKFIKGRYGAFGGEF